VATKKARSGRKASTRATRSSPKAAADPQPAAMPMQRDAGAPITVVGIGASAGGIEAFSALLKLLPPDTGLAFVFVQHLAPGRVSMLAEILQRVTPMRVLEVHDEPRVEANCVYVIPPGRTMRIDAGCLSLAPRGDAPHHPIDDFFESLAGAQGHRAIGVVLSGTATDGTVGIVTIKAAGGITFAQDESASHGGMPQSAIAAGSVDFVLSPMDIARELVRIANDPYLASWVPGSADHTQEIEQVLAELRESSGVDFSQYKPNTLHRRIRRRMALQKTATAAEYATFLRQHPHEIEALYQDVLIGVTEFFRDGSAFETLKSKVLPKLFKRRSRQDPVRAWVLGCATGEETYSLAIALVEFASEAGIEVPIIVYGTDLNNGAIDKARIGLYPRSVTDQLSPERLRRFFVRSDGGYRVSKAIREICVFARHNVLGDPPFSRMDIISCRNVMIYMGASLQGRLLPLLHYALKSTGILFLGPSETVGSSRELFEVEDAKGKIYSKKLVVRRPDQMGFPVGPFAAPRSQPEPPRSASGPSERAPDVQRDADRVLLARYLPPGVLVDQGGEVLQFRGDTGQFLTPAPGKASLNVLKMAREGLLVSLRALLQRAKRQTTVVREEGVRVRSNGGFRGVTLTVIPLGRPGTGERAYWILFEPPAAAAKSTSKRAPGRHKKGAVQAQLEEKDKQISRLLQELSATRDYLQSVIEQQEAANEELQSANEEVQSTNEELQSINEELETSREEIQSSNEELTTVNEELQNRNDELNRANNDLNNLFGSLQMAIVMVGQDLRIRRFTPTAEKLFNLISSDIGRPVGDIKLNLDVADLPRLLAEAIDQVTARELEVRDAAGRWYLLRIRPYRTLDNRIDGAVVVLFDINFVKESQEILERQARLLDQAHEAVFAHELGGRITYWNHGAELLYGFGAEEAIGRSSQELLGIPEEVQALTRETLRREGRWTGELLHHTKEGRQLVVDSIEVTIDEGERRVVLATNRDVTERKRLEDTLQRRVTELAEADRHKSEFLAVLAHELRNPLAPLRNSVEIMKSVPADDPRAARAKDMMERQVRTLTRLVDDLLDMARINRGQVQLRCEQLELQAIVSRAVETAREAVDLRRHRLTVNLPPEPLRVRGDATRLEQVLGNLLQNALKYTPEGGDITVSLAEATNGSDTEAVLRILDTGIGISAEMLPLVFDLFAQADRSLAHSHGGLGIGLSLVRSLVELHGGRVLASSAGLGMGSEFAVYLPLGR
jgi:two-component system, chemotaxis family, CheB/CheR fusion protein